MRLGDSGGRSPTDLLQEWELGRFAGRRTSGEVSTESRVDFAIGTGGLLARQFLWKLQTDGRTGCKGNGAWLRNWTESGGCHDPGAFPVAGAWGCLRRNRTATLPTRWMSWAPLRVRDLRDEDLLLVLKSSNFTFTSS